MADENEPVGESPSGMNRRSALKSGVGALSVLAGVSGSVGAAAAAGRKRPQNSAPPDDEPGDAAPPPSHEVGKKLRQLDGGLMPLLGDRDVTLNYVSAADVPESQRRQARQNVEDLWERVPVKTQTKKVGNGSNKTTVTTYRLQGSVKQANEAIRELTARGMDAKELGATSANGLATVINSGADTLAEEAGGDDVSVQWDPTDSHQIVNYYAGKNLDLDEYYCNVMKGAGDNPDEWDYNVTYLPDSWEDSFNDPGRRWTHARDPENNYGSAHKWARDYMEKSQNASSSYSKYRNLGFALHFLADTGNPLHTGAFKTQIAYNWIHYTYEASAEKHLMLAENNDPDITNYLLNNVDFSMRSDLGPNDYVEVDDRDKFYEFGNKWANHVNRLAKISHDYSLSHALDTYSYGKGADIMALDENLETQIEYLFDEMMQYMMGFVEEYNGDVSY